MEYKNKLRKNVFKNYIFTFINRFDLTRGIWMIYLASKGLSLTEIGLVEAIFHITSFLMEIPTGAVADIWGRKASRICGRISGLIAAIILIYSNSFWGFVIGFIVSALSYNLESGAGEALLYDSLKEIGEEKKYMKVLGKNEIIMQMAQTCGLLLGGFLSNYSYGYAYGVTIVVSMGSIIQAFSFTEPNIKIEIEEKSFKIFKKQVVESFDIIARNKKLAFLIVFSQGIFMFNASIFFYFQNYLLDRGISKGSIGVILATSALAAAITASQTHKIEKKIGEKVIISLFPIIISICIWGVALSKYYCIFFIVINTIDSIVFVAVGDYINKLIPSEKRATILSMASMIFSLYMIVLFPIIGKIGDAFSLQIAFQVLAIIATIMAVINIMVLRRNKKIEY
ncbi:MFS transporter [Clostridium tagluense]|uniref:MFS transporter n=1 Tax=Clostridium tagluense TaxID=360422 RepID=UPI001CF50F33|nr:MFS transporter [Clostridium tagluense]MCB2310270.1 MFS transporter [Clostridium tagluense]MCB2315088.1 MFS transporter [Clostridium tagluense]MCB2319970.1 MFS transporter [Clostridium tagluense]MCB2324831.1 MFS transporter [Clostridium tagluense]MCB2329715.1 MFS transporter [Clostridium tagluense]